MMGLVSNGLGGSATNLILMNYGFFTVEIIETATPVPEPSPTPTPTPTPTIPGPSPTPTPTVPEPTPAVVDKILGSKSEPQYYDVVISVKPFKNKDAQRISFRMKEESVNKVVNFKVSMRKLRVRFNVIINKITEFMRK